MELDEMKLAWQALDRRLAAQQAIQWQGFRDGRLERMQHRLRPLAWWLVVQIPLGNDLIHAPTGAVLLQLRWLCLEGRADPVDVMEQPVFAWK